MYFTKPLLGLLSIAGSALGAAMPVRPELESRVVARATTELIQSGLTFTIFNVKSNTVVDLSDGDNTTVTGWASNGGPNQQWTTIWTGDSWNFQNVHSGTYLGIAGPAENGQNLTASSTPTSWDIWHDDVNASNYRIYIPNTIQNWDLYADGDPTSGDPITLWGAWAGIHQTWSFVLQSA